MNASGAPGSPGARSRAGRSRNAAANVLAGPGDPSVPSLDARRIQKALEARTRYKYVQPRVEREGLGWKVVSPNCSRNIDARGGEIDIAWLVPSGSGGVGNGDGNGKSGGGWLLFSRDHAQDCWQLRQRHASLPAALARLCADPDREFWQ